MVKNKGPFCDILTTLENHMVIMWNFPADNFFIYPKSTENIFSTIIWKNCVYLWLTNDSRRLWIMWKIPADSATWLTLPTTIGDMLVKTYLLWANSDSWEMTFKELNFLLMWNYMKLYGLPYNVWEILWLTFLILAPQSWEWFSGSLWKSYIYCTLNKHISKAFCKN